VYGRVLQTGVRDGRLLQEGERFKLTKRAGWRERWRVGHFFRRSKTRATLRWFKYMLTFDDWLDYIVRKIERRSGERVELTRAERQFPVILLWPKAFRLIRAMRALENDRRRATAGSGERGEA
jgi:hypothetical protein